MLPNVPIMKTELSRRQFLTRTAVGAFAAAVAPRGLAGDAAPLIRIAHHEQALVAITLDLEMSRNFPQWEITHWDYRKGDLDEPTKRYTVEACRRVKERGGVIHCFAVGQVFEQENVDWLKEIVAAGHPVGNHTYDHVRITATKREEIQARFQRAPWLLGDATPRQFIENNIRLASQAMRARLGIQPNGFRTPGGFPNGMTDRPDLQQMLLDLGFTWISSKSRGPRLRIEPERPPTAAQFDSIVDAQRECQPFAYPTGLIEIPFSAISDISAFRAYRWKLDYFLESIRRSLEWVIENRLVYDLLAHPSCLGVIDPEFRAIDLICEMVEKSRGRAAIVGLDSIARNFARRQPTP
jgi:peptidoglycan/xylan/chitin deacetylase (PgdA/CDA1 family)